VARQQDIMNFVPAPNLSLVNRPDSDWERELGAFRELLPELQTKYDGQFVAIKDGKVVAIGSDEGTVAPEAYARVGYGPLYLGQVSDSPRAPIRIPSPQHVRGQDRS
jgi:hypothetical protein